MSEAGQAAAATPFGEASRQLLLDHGLMAGEGRGLKQQLRYERAAYLFDHRLKNCTVGAFTYFNAAGSTSCYRVKFGRYAQIGESSVVGPPEHPAHWFSSHFFSFTRPRYTPGIYQFDDFVRLGPEEQPGVPTYAESTANETVVGHETWLGVGCFVKRGVTIGDGAIVGARSVVTRDVPPYAIVVGSPARVVRLRFADNIVERFLKLQYWRYDLAPFKRQVDFSKVEATLDFFEQRVADGTLQPLRPRSYRVVEGHDGLRVEALDAPLFFNE